MIYICIHDMASNRTTTMTDDRGLTLNDMVVAYFKIIAMELSCRV
jgi:hypothetical protein